MPIPGSEPGAGAPSAPEDTFAAFVADLSRATIGRTTNPYSVHDPELDRDGGAGIRAANLLDYLESRAQPRLMLVGEAPSYQGCRFSGMAFTSERSLPGDRWSSLRPEGWKEPSATIVHGALADLGAEGTTLLWNACPLHPAGEAGPLSNRPPDPIELEEGLAWLHRLIALAQPEVVVAVGQHARRSLPTAPLLRHPAHGGATEFRRGLAELVRASDGRSAVIG